MTARETFVFRQFHIEGFINQYLVEIIAEDRPTISFVIQATENIALGWKAKEYYQSLGPDKFIEVFELTPPDKISEVYPENRFQRVRPE